MYAFIRRPATPSPGTRPPNRRHLPQARRVPPGQTGPAGLLRARYEARRRPQGRPGPEGLRAHRRRHSGNHPAAPAWPARRHSPGRGPHHGRTRTPGTRRRASPSAGRAAGRGRTRAHPARPTWHRTRTHLPEARSAVRLRARPGNPDPLRLRNCPFHPLAAKAPDLVCGINHAFLSGLLTAWTPPVRERYWLPPRVSAAWNSAQRPILPSLDLSRDVELILPRGLLILLWVFLDVGVVGPPTCSCRLLRDLSARRGRGRVR